MQVDYPDAEFVSEGLYFPEGVVDDECFLFCDGAFVEAVEVVFFFVEDELFGLLLDWSEL